MNLNLRTQFLWAQKFLGPERSSPQYADQAVGPMNECLWTRCSDSMDTEVASSNFFLLTHVFVAKTVNNVICPPSERSETDGHRLLFSLLSVCVSVREHSLYSDANVSKTVGDRGSVPITH